MEEKNTNDSNLEHLKNEYDKYVVLVNNSLNKINETMVATQKKNIENSKNLQLKIKAYIDNKIKGIDNKSYVDEVISKLNLSIIEKEKLQKIEMEEIINKKLKEIQKENERILNKKIQEISNMLINQNVYNSSNNIDIIKEKPKQKKTKYPVFGRKRPENREVADTVPIY